MSKYHIILDVDGTLCEETADETQTPKLRPHIKEFLEYLVDTFETISIWSNAGIEWIQPILDKIQTIKYIDFPLH